MRLTKGHHFFMQVKALIIVLCVGVFTKVTCQMSPATAGQLCISECGTCPVICSSPPLPLPTGTPKRPEPAQSPPQQPPSPPYVTIQPLLPPPPATPLPPLLPLLSPPLSVSPPPASHHHPPPPPPSSPPKSSGGSHHSPPPPSVSYPNVVNPGDSGSGFASPHAYYYFYESKASSLSVTSFFVIVFFSFYVFIG